jgi:hypothetical protein
MNIAKVRNSAAIVNYVKPGLEMVEMETEGVLCGSTKSVNVNIESVDGFAGGTGKNLGTASRR